MLSLRKLLLIFIIIVANIGNSNADTNNLSSFQSDTTQINKYIDICGNLIYTNPDSAELYIDSILSLSNKANYKYGLFKGHNLEGIILWVNNELDLALIEYKLALLYSNNLDDPRPKAVVLSNIALLYSTMFNNDSALFYFSKTIQYSKKYELNGIHIKALFDIGSMQLYQDNYVEAVKNFAKVRDELNYINDSVLLMSLYSSFGQLYSKLHKFNQSLQNYKNAIIIAEKIGKQFHVVNTYINIGQLYFTLKNELDSSKYYFNKAIESPLPVFKNRVELSVYINLGNYYLERKQLDSAYLYYQEAFANPLINNYPKHKAAVLVNLGLYHVKKKNYVKARYFLNRGYGLSDTLGIILYKINALGGLTKLDSIIGDFKLSRTHYVELAMLSDSLQSYKAANEIAALEYEKYIEQEKYNNVLLVRENDIKSIMIWVTAGTVLALLILVTLLYLNRTRIKKLLEQLSHKHQDLQVLNEELTVTNETLIAQQEQLRELNISKDKFFTILGHDLKSPFNGLLGILGLLTEEWDIITDKEKRKILKSLFSSSKKTYNLLEDMLSWAKTQQGLIKYNPEMFQIYPKIIEVEDLLKAQLDSKDQELSIDISPNIEIKSDSRLFMQIIQNLLNNAIKFTPVGGKITISAAVNKDILAVSIIDNGVGIPEEEISKIFNIDSDYRRDGTKGEKSTGMGLLLSSEYAKIINAKLSVSSIEGEGSTFRLLIPPTF